jgi:hypothetical protein
MSPFKRINGNYLKVDGYFLMNDKSSFSEGIILRGAHIGNNLEMDGSSFSDIDGARLKIDGDLLLRHQAKFNGDVILRGAQIGGNVDMSGSVFSSAIIADEIKGRRFLGYEWQGYVRQCKAAKWQNRQRSRYANLVIFRRCDRRCHIGRRHAENGKRREFPWQDQPGRRQDWRVHQSLERDRLAT